MSVLRYREAITANKWRRIQYPVRHSFKYAEIETIGGESCDALV